MELKLTAPAGLREPLRELLDASPTVSYIERGWLVKEIVVTGSPESLDALKPHIQKIESEYVSREAW